MTVDLVQTYLVGIAFNKATNDPDLIEQGYRNIMGTPTFRAAYESSDKLRNVCNSDPVFEQLAEIVGFELC